jgi:predicted neuraminidase
MNTRHMDTMKNRTLAADKPLAASRSTVKAMVTGILKSAPMTCAQPTGPSRSWWTAAAFAALLTIILPGRIMAGDTSGIQVLSRATVFQYHTADPYDRDNLYGFNHAPSVVLLPDGRLLAAWFSGTYEASVNQVILGSFSADDGRTWSKARVLQDDPIRSDFDPAFIRAGDRVYMCYSVGRWNKYPSIRTGPGEGAATGPKSFTIQCRWSDDSGKTWSNPVRMHESTGWGCRSNGIQLKSGELMLPTHDFLKWKSASLKSVDGGKTWTRSVEVNPGKLKAAEPVIAQCASGKLVMAVRSRDGVMRFSASTDRGETWSVPRESDIRAGDSSPSLIALSNGALVLTYTASAPPNRTSLGVRVSIDEARTWSDMFELASIDPPKPGDDFWSHSVCYPSAAELPDGRVLVVWTQISMSPTWQGGKIESAVIDVNSALPGATRPGETKAP